MTFARSPRGPRGMTLGARGMTLIELMFVVGVMGVVIAGITKATIDVARTNSIRKLSAAMQGEGRQALKMLERNLRSASLGATTGIIWTQDAVGNVVQRPALQIFDNVSGGGGLDVKPGTDALLVVRATSSEARLETAVQGDQYASTGNLMVTATAGFGVGDGLLLGPNYKGEAAWDTIAAMVAGGFKLSSTKNVFPEGKVSAGVLVRRGQALLYYVSTADELVQLHLLVPRAPASAAEAPIREVLALGVENLQLGCEVDGGQSFGACPAPSPADPAAAEAAWAFGAWGAGGARFTATPPGNPSSAANLRNVILSVVLRSETPLRDRQGDDPVALENQAALTAGGPEPAGQYVRRAYRMPIAVRNLSLGAM